MMVDKGAVEIPSCLEVNNVVHEFFSRDGVNSTSIVLHHALDELVKELKLAGYVPDTSLVFYADIEDEEK
ncbi:Pentatricopeptide repeat-containing protein [Spatholobus suberectus]|nr:Pentatricopeptide repeat-containing protein [Spatholobus suberectus]